MTSYIDFYHYTSFSGKEAIKSCGYIRENSAFSRHAHFGAGVYGTSMSPWSGKFTIAMNNWRGHGRNYVNSGSCDWAIKLRIPSDKVEKVGGFRDILLYKDRLYLKDYTWEEIKVPL